MKNPDLAMFMKNEYESISKLLSENKRSEEIILVLEGKLIEYYKNLASKNVYFKHL
jgi:hypothetical protein